MDPRRAELAETSVAVRQAAHLRGLDAAYYEGFSVLREAAGQVRDVMFGE
jgi:hypothetical protein